MLPAVALLGGIALCVGFARAPRLQPPEPAERFLFDETSPAFALYGATGGTWLTGSHWDNATLERVVRLGKDTGKLPVIVIYAIPDRDRGGGSAGGARNRTEYLKLVEGYAKQLADSRAVVVLEPDALPLGLSPDLVREAVVRLRRHAPRVSLYLDAGHSNWHGPETMAERLIAAGIHEADGFSLNVSAFEWTEDNLIWGARTLEALRAKDPELGAKRFVIDTSRNGNGPGVDEKGERTWGDPVRALNGGPIMTGPQPTFETGYPGCAAFLWVKTPGYGDNRIRSASEFGGKDWVLPGPR